jgi:hypothetical protein
LKNKAIMKKKTIIAILAGIIMMASGLTAAPGRGLIGPAQVPDVKTQPNGNPSGLHLVRWENRHQEARPTIAAEKEILIVKIVEE